MRESASLTKRTEYGSLPVYPDPTAFYIGQNRDIKEFLEILYFISEVMCSRSVPYISFPANMCHISGACSLFRCFKRQYEVSNHTDEAYYNGGDAFISVSTCLDIDSTYRVARSC